MKRGASDEVDRRLIALLLENARQSTMALAKQLGLARTTVQCRLAQLERRRVIIGYSALLGYDPGRGFVQSVAFLSIVKRSQKNIVERLKQYPEIKLCLTVDGDFDLMLIIEAAQNEDIEALTEEIAEIPDVVRSKSIMVLSAKFDRRTVMHNCDGGLTH
ncbi:MAG: Lrp/AsnC family transcriptional regulator [Hyphomicrobiales bacterium]|nr:Lrp/AsnC family transcriptional regulator [Hyphomicrobiales bacterium]